MFQSENLVFLRDNVLVADIRYNETVVKSSEAPGVDSLIPAQEYVFPLRCISFKNQKNQKISHKYFSKSVVFHGIFLI